MSALEINIMSSRFLDLDSILTYMSEFGASLVSIVTIDNWHWENERPLIDIEKAKRLVDNGNKIIINLNISSLKASGLIIMREQQSYICEFWLNDSRFDNINIDDITCIYDFYTAIADANKYFGNCFTIVGMGIEIMLNYDENVSVMVSRSKNISSWMINESLNIDAIGNGYVRAKTENGFDVFEKVGLV